MTYAKIITDSISPTGHRLTTMEVRFHRFVLAEFNTHRVFSRNSASSRAIPLTKQIDRLQTDPAYPVSWPKEQKGMQGGDELDAAAQDFSYNLWSIARLEAMKVADALGKHELHKSVTNRLLEPFMWHTVVVTSTAWENFFNLRLDKMAQPEIRVAAEMMKAAYDGSTPNDLREGEWHLPYIYGDDWQEIPDFEPHEAYSHLTKISAARCARVSYLTQDGKRDHEADLDLYDRLTSNGHSSPLEHVATPAPWNIDDVEIRSVTGRQYVQASGGINVETPCMFVELPRYGNLVGWHQLRMDVEAQRQYRAYL